MSKNGMRELGNGLRVVYERAIGVNSVHVGALVDVGTRDEELREHGMAHLVEHMVFKGTKKRKGWHILNSLDSVGGELNAFTSRERTFYHSVVGKRYLERSIDLLSDMLINPTFPQKEIEKERQVIIEEIQMYKDIPEEMIFEEFEGLLFPDEGLGRSILGSEQSLQAIDVESLKHFHSKYYVPSRCVLSVVGSFSYAALERYVDKYFGNWEERVGEFVERKSKGNQAPFEIIREKNYHQSHLIIGGYAPSYYSEESYALNLLLYGLGGDTMNNKLSLELRERLGLCYNVYTFYSGYNEIGLWGIYAGFDSSDYKRLRRGIDKVLRGMVEGMTERRLEQIKRQFIGHTLLSYEGLHSRMQFNARNVLEFGRLMSIKEVLEKYEKLQLQDIQTVGERYLLGGQGVLVYIGKGQET